MIRMNHNGAKMDAEDYNTGGPGKVSEVVMHTKQVRAEGMGVISMKLVGEGRFTRPEDRDASMKFAMNLGCVDAVTIGFQNTMANAERWAGGVSGPAYAIDDETAIKVVDDIVEVVSEGDWKLLTP